MFLVYALYVAAIGISVISLLSVILRLISLREYRPTGCVPVSVILPLTGEARSFGALLEALNKQTLRPACLLVTVESELDPAYARVQAEAHNASFPIKLVVAGPATHQAQKCRNQQAALDQLDPEIKVLVLMDGDIVPDSEWLGGLVWPIVSGQYDIISGHRWQQVAKHRIGAHFVTAADRAITLLPRIELDCACVTWGGSIAMTTLVAQRLDLRSLLDRVLSDDLALARRAAELGLRVGTHKSLLVPSPNRQSFVSAWHFARRQYQMCRIYRPALWRLGLCVVGLRLSGWGAAMWFAVMEGTAMWVLASLMTLGVFKQYGISEVSRQMDMPDSGSVRLVQIVLGCLQPIVDVFHLSVIAAAHWAARVRWGHVTYRVSGPDNIQVEAREPFGGRRPLERDYATNLGDWELAEIAGQGTEPPPVGGAS
ncbi:Glycosyl transferase [Bordetella tumbae]|uniref:glycosyltransferase n=1 Tax=Bordetella tumbae TaxID=1649139 RepID=UPI0039EE25C6